MRARHVAAGGGQGRSQRRGSGRGGGTHARSRMRGARPGPGSRSRGCRRQAPGMGAAGGRQAGATPCCHRPAAVALLAPGPVTGVNKGNLPATICSGGQAVCEARAASSSRASIAPRPGVLVLLAQRFQFRLRLGPGPGPRHRPPGWQGMRMGAGGWLLADRPCCGQPALPARGSHGEWAGTPIRPLTTELISDCRKKREKKKRWVGGKSFLNLDSKVSSFC